MWEKKKHRGAIKNLCKSAERRFRQSLNKRIKKRKEKIFSICVICERKNYNL